DRRRQGEQPTGAGRRVRTPGQAMRRRRLRRRCPERTDWRASPVKSMRTKVISIHPRDRLTLRVMPKAVQRLLSAGVAKPGEAFAAILRRAWERLPAAVRKELLRYWSPGRDVRRGQVFQPIHHADGTQGIEMLYPLSIELTTVGLCDMRQAMRSVRL